MSIPLPLPLSTPPHTSFTIQGNIGCGKSTFLKIIQKYFPQLQLIQEPVNEWQNMANKGINMLQKYYKESTRWGFTFLNYAAFTRVRRFIEKKGHTGIYTLSERSVLSDKYIFGPLMSDLGFMTESEYLLFKEMYKGYEEMLQSPLPKVIYLQCEPKVCSERTKKRQRSEEDSIPFSYFQKLHQLHEEWMKGSSESEMLVVNTSDDFENNPELIEEMVMKLNRFIYGEKPQQAKTVGEGNGEEVVEKAESTDSEVKNSPQRSKEGEESCSSEQNIENEELAMVEKKESMKAA